MTWDAAAAEKGGFATFMDKEIHDQPSAVADTLRGRVDDRGKLKLDEGIIDESVLNAIDKIIVVACGTAFYAGLVAKYAIEHWTRIPVEVELAHEFRYRDPVLSVRTLVVAISQSGETMDTIMAVRHAQQQGATVVAIVNVQGSTIAREADAVLYTRAGPEIAVASTKAFLAQITASYLLGIYLAELRGNKFPDEIAALLAQLNEMPAKIQFVLDTSEPLRELAHSMVDERTVLFLGRHVGYPVALEGALKLKELAYIHAEGFAAGELKHGPIALIEQGQPVFIVLPSPRGREVLHSKVISNIQEVRARGARTFVIAEEGDTEAAAACGSPLHGSTRRPRFSCRSSLWCRSRSSRSSWRLPRATTWTSRATSRSPSRWSSPWRSSASASMWSTRALRASGRALASLSRAGFHAGGARVRPPFARRPLGREGGAREGARRACRACLARCRGPARARPATPP